MARQRDLSNIPELIEKLNWVVTGHGAPNDEVRTLAEETLKDVLKFISAVVGTSLPVHSPPAPPLKVSPGAITPTLMMRCPSCLFETPMWSAGDLRSMGLSKCATVGCDRTHDDYEEVRN